MSSGTTSRVRRRRRRLWNAQAGLCFWCDTPTQLPEWRPRTESSIGWPTMATLDHLDDRFSLLRGAFRYSDKPRTVMACWTCNQQRSVTAIAATPVELLRTLSAKTAVPNRNALRLVLMTVEESFSTESASGVEDSELRR